MIVIFRLFLYNLNMSENNKDFFEKLAGINYEEGENEVEAQLDRASSKSAEKVQEEDVLSIGKEEELEFDDAEGHLTIDVYQNENNIVIESAIAGVEADEIDVAITPESVTIRGKREKKEKVRNDEYLYQECFWGKFSRSVILPEEIDPDKAHFTLKRGVLTIYLPKVHKDRVRKIQGRELKDD